MSRPALLSALHAAARPILSRIDAETAHGAAIAALRLWPCGAAPAADPRLARRVAGMRFAHPLGLAAGFDKQAEVADRLIGLGFAFVEVGGVTPLPQPGNPRPRAFRLAEDRAIVNRYGLNSIGMEAFAAALAAVGARAAGPIGVNLGTNKDSADRAADYAVLVGRLAPLADYLSINVSSPNTAGLRDLQAVGPLRDLLARCVAARAGAGAGAAAPIFVKIAPDLEDAMLDAMVEAAIDAGVEGIIVANTTTARPASLASPHRREAGGLSGAPLFARSTRLLARARIAAGGRLALVGVGGVMGPDDLLAKLEAGADLVQAYTGFAFEGPGFPARCVEGLLARLDAEGLADVGALVGRRAEAWAGRQAEADR
jgi:dihydroorotate dehydrogenase